MNIPSHDAWSPASAACQILRCAQRPPHAVEPRWRQRKLSRTTWTSIVASARRDAAGSSAANDAQARAGSWGRNCAVNFIVGVVATIDA